MTAQMQPDACPVCRNAAVHALAPIDGLTYWRCATCEATFLDPRHFLSADAERAHYLTHENAPDDPGYRRFMMRLAAPLMARLSVGEVGGRREPQQQGEPLPHPRVAAASRRDSSPCCPAPPGGGRTRATCQCSSTCSTRCSSPTRAQACPRLARLAEIARASASLPKTCAQDPPHSFVHRIEVRHARRLRAALRPQRARGNSALALRSSPLPPSS